MMIRPSVVIQSSSVSEERLWEEAVLIQTVEEQPRRLHHYNRIELTVWGEKKVHVAHSHLFKKVMEKAAVCTSDWSPNKIHS